MGGWTQAAIAVGSAIMGSQQEKAGEEGGNPGLDGQGNSLGSGTNTGVQVKGKDGTKTGNLLGNDTSDAQKVQRDHEIEIAHINAGNGPQGRPQTAGTGKAAEPEKEPEKELGKLGKVNKFLGTNTGKLATTVGMKYFNDRRAEKQYRKQHSYQKTHGDFGGGGSFSGGPATPPQTTNVGETAKDRAVKQQTADSLAGRLKMDKNIQPYKISQILMQNESMAADVMMKRLQYDSFWAIKAATMGAENLKMAILMHGAGIDLEAMLQVAQPPTAEQADAYRNVYLLLNSEDGRIANEVKGLLGLGGIVSSAFSPDRTR